MKTITVRTTITDAEVYRQGCTVTSKGAVALVEGENRLIIEGLPYGLVESSVSLRMPEAVRQGQVRVMHSKTPAAMERDEEDQELTRQLDELDVAIQNKELELSAWHDLAKRIDGSVALEFLDRLPVMLGRLSEEMIDLRAKRLEVARQRDKVRQGQDRSHLEVSLVSERADVMPLELICRSTRAGWKPSYDVLVDKLGEPLKLRLKGEAWQSTGDDWHEVTLRLNTGTGSVSGDLPRFVPRYLSKVEKYERSRSMDYALPAPAAKASMDSMRSAPAPSAHALGDTTTFTMSEVAAPGAKVDEQQTAISYELVGPQTLVSEGDAQMLTVATTKLAATYNLYTYPRKEEAAYLVAHLEDEPAPEVLEQPLAVYLEGSYAGTIRIGRSGDTTGYELPLGRDNRVRVRRTEEQRRSKRLLSGKETRDHSCTIVVEGRRHEAAKLVVLEQVPVSHDKDIEVSLRDAPGASFDKDRGELRWTSTLEPGGKLQFQASYSVSHAADIELADSDANAWGSLAQTVCFSCGALVPRGESYCKFCGSRIY